ncbi:MAG: FHA domain-containing protein [Planctomycetes bacterium]|nr:FHA domain-containing protein [Planctomycetota bacterium]
MAFRKLIQCPACRFTNRLGDARCMICKAPLPQAAGDGAPAPPQAAGPAAQAGAPTPPRRPGPPGPRPGPPRDRPPPPPDVRRTAPMKRPVPTEATSADAAPVEPPPPARKATPTTRIVASEVDPSAVIGWLCCDPLPPIPLGGKPVLTIGRHHDCDLVLPHKEVSRRHAVVKVRAGTIVFEDEGSSNGSFVNGQRVSHTTLRLGDVVTIGPYEVELKSNEDMAAKDERSETKTNLELTAVSRLSPLAAMTGKLQEVPLAEVLQGIEFNKKTGTLTVSADRQQGVLVVHHGEPRFARWGDLTDDEAVLRMLTLLRGRFAFVAEPEPGERTMRGTLTGLLLEASRRIDEGETAPTDEGAPLIDLDDPPAD